MKTAKAFDIIDTSLITSHSVILFDKHLITNEGVRNIKVPPGVVGVKCIPVEDLSQPVVKILDEEALSRLGWFRK